MNRFFTTHQAARLLGVSLPTVVNWIEARSLRCHRTPGGHRRIAREDLAAFMLRHGMPVPEELADAAPPRRTALVIGELGPLREGTVRQLAALGWAVEVASPGFAAGAALARFRPHLAVLLAPGPDGGETLRALRSDREAGATPVVAIGLPAWGEALRAAGATAVLAHPATLEALHEAARSVVEPLPEARGAGGRARDLRGGRRPLD